MAPGASAAQGNASDPNSIITRVISGGATVKSFHIKIELNGTVKAAALSGAAGANAQLKGDLKLDGTAVQGDVDVANQAAHLTASVPPLAMTGNVPINADLIVKGQILYYKTSMTGPKYLKLPLSGLANGLPVTLPTPGASVMAGTQDEVAKLRKQLDDAGAKATLVGVDQIGGKDAYHINVSVPLALINNAVAAQASSAPNMKIDSASIDAWVYKDNSQLAKLEVKGASAAIGSLDFVITITNYDQPVTIAAPPAAEVSAP